MKEGPTKTKSEKKDVVPKNREEMLAFSRTFLEMHAEVQQMLRDGEAYFKDTRDQKGRLKSFQILKNNGDLLYYENLEVESKPKLMDKQMD